MDSSIPLTSVRVFDEYISRSFGTAALQRSTIVNLRRNGTFSHCHRDLRRHGLLGFAANKRNRNSHGARRSAIGHLPARRWTSYDAGRH